MKSILILTVFFFTSSAYCFFGNKSPLSVNLTTGKFELKDSAKIYIRGRIVEKGTKEALAGASVKIKGTNMMAIADNSGKFLIDISRVASSMKCYTLQAFYVNSEMAELVIKKRIRKSISVEIEMTQSPGQEVSGGNKSKSEQEKPKK